MTTEPTNAALPHPIRVLVKGSSLVVQTPDWHGVPGEYAFPRWIQNGLHDRGRLCEIDNQGRAGELTSAGIRHWGRDVLPGSPDVVVLAYGYYECIHGLLPRWLERHVHTFDDRVGAVRSRYRRWFLKPTWRLLAQGQRILDQRMQDRFFGRRERRIVRDYELLVRRTQLYAPGSPAVFVMALFGPSGKPREWFPGMQARIDRINAALVEMVARIDAPSVRLVPVHEIAAGLGADEDPVPDGIHYSPRMRRALGAWLAAEIDAAIPRSDGAPRG